MKSLSTCSISYMPSVDFVAAPTAVVVSLSPGILSPAVKSAGFLRLTFHDVEQPIHGRRFGARHDHIESFFSFLANSPACLVIGCQVGLSRSPALAILALVHDGVAFCEACKSVKRAIPTASPNRHVLRLGMEVLGRVDSDIAQIAMSVFDYRRTMYGPIGYRQPPSVIEWPDV